MLRRLLVLVLLAGCATAPRLSKIDLLANTPPFDHSMWGIVVEDDAGRRLYARNAGTLFIPASNRKLFSGATAASCLGFDRQLSTDFFLDGDDLVIRGGGDPSFGGRWTFDRDALFDPVVSALRARGIGAIAGDIVADVAAFDRITIPPQWEVEDVGSSYAPPVDALAYNENVVGDDVENCAKPLVTTDPLFVEATANVTCAEAGEPTITSDAFNRLTVTGPLPRHYHALVSIANPALYAAQALAAALKHAGIAVRGSLRTSVAPRAWRERIATISSVPMWQLLSVEMKPSQNLYAETLYKNAGLGTYAGAQEAERRFLATEVAVDPVEFRFVDGSGVSATNFVSPEAAVKVMRWMNHPVRRGAWWLIPGVNSLSGIVKGTNGGTRFFTIFLNHHAASSGDAQRVIDAIAREIAAF